MISVNVFSNEKAWSKRLKRKELFFKRICKAFPKKYQFSHKKVNFTILLSNNKNIKKLNREFRKKINLQIFYHSLLMKKKNYPIKLILETL